MNSISKLLAAIPERVVRTPTGTPMRLGGENAPQQERVVHLSKLLNWLTPFNVLDAETQRALGLLAVRDKPLDRDDDEGDID